MRTCLQWAAIAAVTLISSTACAATDEGTGDEATPTVTETVTASPDEAGQPVPTATVTTTQTVTPTPEPQSSEDDQNLPEGYPEVVPVGSLPSQIRSAFEEHAEAVALAPGVWTALPEGATVESAVESGGHYGWCASIEAFVDEYRDGERAGGSCW